MEYSEEISRNLINATKIIINMSTFTENQQISLPVNPESDTCSKTILQADIIKTFVGQGATDGKNGCGSLRDYRAI
jgi:hypothetical protein